jgi:hypothetical protein
VVSNHHTSLLLLVHCYCLHNRDSQRWLQGATSGAASSHGFRTSEVSKSWSVLEASKCLQRRFNNLKWLQLFFGVMSVKTMYMSDLSEANLKPQSKRDSQTHGASATLWHLKLLSKAIPNIIMSYMDQCCSVMHRPRSHSALGIKAPSASLINMLFISRHHTYLLSKHLTMSYIPFNDSTYRYPINSSTLSLCEDSDYVLPKNGGGGLAAQLNSISLGVGNSHVWQNLTHVCDVSQPHFLWPTWIYASTTLYG